MAVRCIECEHVNPSETVRCERCGTAIPQRNIDKQITTQQTTGITTGVKLGIGFFLGIVLCIGACGLFLTPSSFQKQEGVTLTQYNQLRDGMTYSEVTKILGRDGVEVSSNSIGEIKTVMYQWNGSGNLGANMNAMFQNGKLISKAQYGLQ